MSEAIVPAAAAPRRRRLRLALGVALFAGLGVIAWRALDHARLADGLRRLGPGALVGVLAISLLHIALRSLRFHWLVRRAGASAAYRLREGVRIFAVGLSASVVTPARAGDLVKAAMLRPYGLPASAGLGIVAVERALDLLVITGSVALCSAFVPGEAGGAAWRVVALGGLATMAAGVLVLSRRPLRDRLVALALGPGARLGLDRPLRRHLDTVHAFFAGWDAVFGDARRLGGALAFSACAWAVEYAKLGFVLAALGAPVPAAVVGLAYPVALLSGLVSLLPASEGVVGLTGVALLAAVGGVDPATAAVAVVIDRAGSNLPPAALGLALSVLPRTRASAAALGDACEP